MSHSNLYLSLSLSAIKAVAATCADNSRFDKPRLLARSKSLPDLVMRHGLIRRKMPAQS